MLQTNKKFKLRILFSFVLIAAGIYLFKSTDTRERQVTVIQTSDIHSVVIGKKGGMLKLAAAVKKCIKENGGYDKCLLVDCGDLFQGTFEGAETKGQITVPIFNKIQFDAFIPGNHDFDFGRKSFIKLTEQLNCDIIAANLKVKNICSKIIPWKIYKKNGKKIAVIGMTNPNIDYWLWGKRYKGIKVVPIEKVLRKTLTEVLDRKPDFIILAAHQGLYQSKRYPKGSNLINIAWKFPQIDLILGAHSHKTIPGKLLAGRTVFVEPGAYAEYFSKIKINFKNTKKRISTRIVSTAAYKPIKMNNKINVLEKLKNSKLENISNKDRPVCNLIPFAMKRYAKTQAAICSISKNRNKLRIKNYGDLFKLIPYEDKVIVIYLTGQELKLLTKKYLEYIKNCKYKTLLIA
ncbi:MAG: metallophosphoesterase, partial [Victivallales bacterium]|nr:metallophosphoesterase [Victivallales bacterium]